MISPASPRTIVSLLLFAALLIGIAHAALIPPFEGIDEAAHYSYIQQLTDTGRWTRRGDGISQDVDAYVKVAPTGMDKAQPYERFFVNGTAMVDAGRDAAHLTPPEPRMWRPGAVANWQAQHPPLYYLLMAPVYQVSKTWSLGSQLFLIRVTSYLLAWGALCIAAFSALRMASQQKESTAAFALALWPVFFPMWFPEMARVGNDGLVALISALIALAMAASVSSASIVCYVLLAGLMSLGLLTKATIIPVAAAVSVVLLVEAHRARADAILLRRRLLGFFVYATLTAAICG